MIPRTVRQDIEQALEVRTAVLLAGLPRVGRSTLANTWIEETEGLGIAFDADSYREDIALTTTFLEMIAGHLVVIENIVERSIDPVARLVRAAASGTDRTRFLLIVQGQAFSPKLATALAGMVRCIEVSPIQPDEAFRDVERLKAPSAGPIVAELKSAPMEFKEWNQDLHWLRGGFPQSLEAGDDDSSFQWRKDYKDALLNGDFGDWSLGPADRVLEVLSRVVDAQGQIFDEDKCRSELSLDKSSLRNTLNMLERMGLIRSLPNTNRGGNPVLYIRDSGLFHAMRGVRTREQLRADDLHGHSWESFAAEALILATGNRAKASFYRDKDGNEIDLILDFTPAHAAVCAIEFKVSDQSDPQAGFWLACQKIQPTQMFVVHSFGSTRMGRKGVEAISLLGAIARVKSIFS